MKNKILISIIFTVFYFAPSFITKCTAQEFNIKKYRILYKFKTVKLPDNKRLLEVSFIARNKKDKKDKLPIYDAEINFYSTLDGEELLIGTAKTSEDGIARFTAPADQRYLTYDGGKFDLVAKFKGSDKLKAQRKKLTVQDAYITLELNEADSVKTITAKAYTTDSTGTKKPIEEATINFYIKGMLSKMKIEEGEIENGAYEFTFPEGIPGDASGNVTVFATIEDHDDFGNIEQVESINWGTTAPKHIKNKNMLWSDAAPIWMYVALTILLVGVWTNYIYTVLNIFKIKRISKISD